jgi:hypothetical protein
MKSIDQCGCLTCKLHVERCKNEWECIVQGIRVNRDILDVKMCLACANAMAEETKESIAQESWQN